MTGDQFDPVVADWERFRRLHVMTNHWDRPGWRPGRESFHWFLTFDGADDLRRLAAEGQEQLRYPFLDPVSADGLHLTLRRLGFADEVPRGEVDRVVALAAARVSALAPFLLRVGPLAGSAGAVRFTVTPWEPVVALRAAVGGDSATEKKFRPHIGIAYCNQEVPAQAVVERVAKLRDLPSVQLWVDTVSLVRLRREGRSYRWNTVATASLAGPAASLCGMSKAEDSVP